MDFKGAQKYILARLKNELTPVYCYHSIGHTLDVLHASHLLAKLEKLSGNQKILLETAALYHDSGILNQYREHESFSVSIARETLPRFGYSQFEINEIAGLIMITKLPQKAVSLTEKILCDADLDYLGRDDFFIHSFELQLEWKNLGIRQTGLREWLELQVDFLESHQYFTSSANTLRKEKKERHLNQIKKIVALTGPYSTKT